MSLLVNIWTTIISITIAITAAMTVCVWLAGLYLYREELKAHAESEKAAAHDKEVK